jgi:hypothetical protein
MIEAVMAVVAAAAAAFVLAPLGSSMLPGRRVPEWDAPEADGERPALERAGLAQALRDLELDRVTGKLSDADYAELAARYRARALEMLRRDGTPPDQQGSRGRGGEA